VDWAWRSLDTCVHHASRVPIMSGGGSFTEKLMRATFIITREGAQFPSGNGNKLVLQGLRMSAKVTTVNRQSMISSIEIWGMKNEDMNALTVAWSAPNGIVLDNSLIIEAGDRTRMSEVFRGTLIEAQPNYSSSPEVSFVAQAMGGYFAAVETFPDSSWQGSVSIFDIATKILKGTEYTVVDGGAKGVLSNPKFTGSRWQQLGTACESTRTDWYVIGNKIVLCDFNTPLTEIPAIILSPASGLIGYPRLERAGLVAQAIFDPALACGTAVEIRGSIVPYANGRWFPQKVTHSLEANMPNGRWESEMFCLRVGGLS
jgi:hypothetical protein